MKTIVGTIVLVLLLGLSGTPALADSAPIGVTGYCAIFGPTSYETNAGVFHAAVNQNLVNATCKWTIEDFDLGTADVRTYSGLGFNVCTIWFGSYPAEYFYTGSGHSTISADGQVTVKCQAAREACTPHGASCPGA